MTKTPPPPTTTITIAPSLMGEGGKGASASSEKIFFRRKDSIDAAQKRSVPVVDPEKEVSG